jgi:thiol:disulfide interchange protein
LIGSGFAPMKIDLTDQNSPAQVLARDWRIDAIPTLIVLSPEGREVGRVTGVLDAAEFRDWLGQMQKLDTTAPTTQSRTIDAPTTRHE